MPQIFAGFICGYALALFSTPLLAYGLLKLRAESPLLARLFPARVRFSGIGLSLNISFTLLSGLGPLAANALIATSGWHAAPALIVIVVGLIGVAASLTLRTRDAAQPLLTETK